MYIIILPDFFPFTFTRSIMMMEKNEKKSDKKCVEVSAEGLVKKYIKRRVSRQYYLVVLTEKAREKKCYAPHFHFLQAVGKSFRASGGVFSLLSLEWPLELCISQDFFFSFVDCACFQVKHSFFFFSPAL